ncbi:MAG TPA: DUF427 domain-containing protein [Mycobacteriales bacterium]|nr:DUF427 domain-containing protein [Mycobacteriales bacterium]
MSVRMRDVLSAERDELRRELLPRRLRGVLGGETVIDTTRAMLVWEPRRVVPGYAVPAKDVTAAVEPDPAAPPAAPEGPMVFPGTPFAAHTTPGEPLLLRSGDRTAQAFRTEDDGLSGYLLVDFAGLDAWYEEDEQRIGHPRDPYSRIDVLPSSRHVRIERDGVLLAESDRPALLFETGLPVRYYLPAEDVRVPLEDSALTTICSYKGVASYKSVRMPDGTVLDDLVWYYPAPFNDAAPVKDLLAFYDEKVDVTVDGARRGQPRTEWS